MHKKDIWELFRKEDILPEDDWAALVFIEVYPNGTFDTPFVEGSVKPLGYIFVIEPARHDPKYKLPGGHKEDGETPLESAVREVRGETGLHLPPNAFRYIGSYWRPRPEPHWSCLFQARAEESEISKIHEFDVENEGEIPKFLPDALFREMVHAGGFLAYHLQRLFDAKLVSA